MKPSLANFNAQAMASGAQSRSAAGFAAGPSTTPENFRRRYMFADSSPVASPQPTLSNAPPTIAAVPPVAPPHPVAPLISVSHGGPPSYGLALGVMVPTTLAGTPSVVSQSAFLEIEGESDVSEFVHLFHQVRCGILFVRTSAKISNPGHPPVRQESDSSYTSGRLAAP